MQEAAEGTVVAITVVAEATMAAAVTGVEAEVTGLAVAAIGVAEATMVEAATGAAATEVGAASAGASRPAWLTAATMLRMLMTMDTITPTLKSVTLGDIGS